MRHEPDLATTAEAARATPRLPAPVRRATSVVLRDAQQGASSAGLPAAGGDVRGQASVRATRRRKPRGRTDGGQDRARVAGLRVPPLLDVAPDDEARLNGCEEVETPWGEECRSCGQIIPYPGWTPEGPPRRRRHATGILAAGRSAALGPSGYQPRDPDATRRAIATRKARKYQMYSLKRRPAGSAPAGSSEPVWVDGVRLTEL